MTYNLNINSFLLKKHNVKLSLNFLILIHYCVFVVCFFNQTSSAAEKRQKQVCRTSKWSYQQSWVKPWRPICYWLFRYYYHCICEGVDDHMRMRSYMLSFVYYAMLTYKRICNACVIIILILFNFFSYSMWPL